jgi:hypothetical protein
MSCAKSGPLFMLQDAESGSSFSVEFSMALLMNVSLRSEGRRACEAAAPAILQLCESLLLSANDQVRAGRSFRQSMCVQGSRRTRP